MPLQFHQSLGGHGDLEREQRRLLVRDHGRAGYSASWRPLHENRAAIKIAGSPFPTLAEAEGACRNQLNIWHRDGPLLVHASEDARRPRHFTPTGS